MYHIERYMHSIAFEMKAFLYLGRKYIQNNLQITRKMIIYVSLSFDRKILTISNVDNYNSDEDIATKFWHVRVLHQSIWAVNIHINT